MRTITDDLEEFVRLHRAHGQLVGDATEPTLTGYRLTIACPCGATFERHCDGRRGVDRPGDAGEAELTSPAQGRRNLTAALAFAQLAPAEPELRLLHRWLDTWSGLGAVAGGMERHGYRLSLSHIAAEEWRAVFATHPQWAPAGYGVAPTPWRAVLVAAGAALRSGQASALNLTA